VLNDLFTTGSDKTLKNDNEYHFAAIAYAHNNWKTYDTIDNFGQKAAFLSGRSNYKVASFIPSFVADNEEYHATITRISGVGNPGNFLLVEDEMYDKMLSQDFDGKIKYKNGAAPIGVNVLDPTLIKPHKYLVTVKGTFHTFNCQYDQDATWMLEDLTSNKVIIDKISLLEAKEYVFDSLGFSVVFKNAAETGSTTDANNGAIGARLKYKDVDKPRWLDAVRNDGFIRNNEIQPLNFLDQQSVKTIRGLESMGDEFFVPYLATKYATEPDFYISPAAREFMSLTLGLKFLKPKDLNNVDIVLTKDKSKWSKCVVVESCFKTYTDSGYTSIGNALNFEIRQSPSINKEGKPLNDGTTGFSYFPGYAVDVETGQRVNIFFSENSCFSGNNTKHLNGDKSICTDMIFNPSDQLFSIVDSSLVAGGQHFIYVTRSQYDSCQVLKNKLDPSNSNITKARATAAITWTSLPILAPQTELTSVSDGIIPNDIVVQLRVTNPHGRSTRFDTENINTCVPIDDKPVYEFGFEQINSAKTVGKDDLNVFLIPNPLLSGQQGTIKIKKASQNLTVEVFNMQGYKIGSIPKSSLASSGEYSTIEVDTHTWTPGMYLIKLTDSITGNSKTLKWVVLR
jgi:hypothetical protein